MIHITNDYFEFTGDVNNIEWTFHEINGDKEKIYIFANKNIKIRKNTMIECSIPSAWYIAPELHNCPVSYGKKVVISERVREKTEYLLSIFPNNEWLAYIIGKNEIDQFYAEDLIIPKQKIPINYGISASVIDIVTPNVPNIIGNIHSHHSAYASEFSSIDRTYLLGNHDLSIVVSTVGWKGSVRVHAPCGNFVNMDCVLEFKNAEIVTPVKQGFLMRLLWPNHYMKTKLQPTNMDCVVDVSNIQIIRTDAPIDIINAVSSKNEIKTLETIESKSIADKIKYWWNRNKYLIKY